MLLSKIACKKKYCSVLIFFYYFIVIVNVANAQDQGYEFDYLSINDSALKESIEQKLETQLRIISGVKNKSEIKKIFKERHENYIKWIEDSTFIYNAKVNTYLNKVLQNIYKVNPGIQHDDFTFFINKSLIPNAACFGDKNFMINLGLFTFLDSEDELAFILCHEIAHYQLDHVNSKITSFVEKVNNRDTKKEIREIKDLKYGRNTTGLEFLKNLTFNFINHTRKFEIEADSLGFLLFKKTKYNHYDAIRCLEKLDSIEDQIFQDTVNLKTRLSFKNYPFKNSWLEEEQTLFEIEEKIDDYEWNKDSLKTHPDAKLRAQLLAKTTSNKTKTAFEGFTSLKYQLNYQVINLLLEAKKLDLALYLLLKYSKENQKADDFYITKMATLFATLYDIQKNHKLGKYISPVSSLTKEKNLNQIRQFLHNLELKNIRKIGYNFCLRYEDKIINDEEFTTIFTKFKTLNAK